jgi:hypothetical protein
MHGSAHEVEERDATFSLLMINSHLNEKIVQVAVCMTLA